MWIETERIVEPFVKAAFAKWLADRGAREITVSIDGMEVSAAEFPAWMALLGFEFCRDAKSKAAWVGRFGHASGCVLTTCCRPGIDVSAIERDGTMTIAECKGEPTKSGIGSGSDLTSLYQCIGQLIVSAGKIDPVPTGRFLVVAKSLRIASTVRDLATNPLLASAGIKIATVDARGDVALL